MQASSSSSCARGTHVFQGYADEGGGIKKSRSESPSALTGHVVWNRHANDSSSSCSKNSSEGSLKNGIPGASEEVLFMNDSSSCDSSNKSEARVEFEMERSQSEQLLELPHNQKTEALKALPYEQLLALLPDGVEGPSGPITSIGSMEHDTEVLRCSPCAFMMRGRGCKQGIYCSYCHFKHGPEVKAYRPRHPKKQRIRFKNTLDQLKAEVEARPETFNADRTRYPAWLEVNEGKKEKMKTILKEHQLQTRALNAVDRYQQHKAAPSRFSL